MLRNILRVGALLYAFAFIGFAVALTLDKVLPYKRLCSFPYDSHHCHRVAVTLVVDPLVIPALLAAGTVCVLAFVLLSQHR